MKVLTNDELVELKSRCYQAQSTGAAIGHSEEYLLALITEVQRLREDEKKTAEYLANSLSYIKEIKAILNLNGPKGTLKISDMIVTHPDPPQEIVDAVIEEEENPPPQPSKRPGEFRGTSSVMADLSVTPAAKPPRGRGGSTRSGKGK